MHFQSLNLNKVNLSFTLTVKVGEGSLVEENQMSLSFALRGPFSGGGE